MLACILCFFLSVKFLYKKNKSMETSSIPSCMILFSAHWNLRDLRNLIPLPYIRYLHIVLLLRLHSFPWKGYNFHRLKNMFREYSIKCMKELLLWLLFSIGYGSITKIVYILQIYVIWIARNIKYDIRLLLTLFPFKLM